MKNSMSCLKLSGQDLKLNAKNEIAEKLKWELNATPEKEKGLVTGNDKRAGGGAFRQCSSLGKAAQRRSCDTLSGAGKRTAANKRLRTNCAATLAHEN
jgi:hypothetical protein